MVQLMLFLLLLLFGLVLGGSIGDAESVLDGKKVLLKNSNDVFENVIITRKLNCVPNEECRLMFAYSNFSKCRFPESWSLETHHQSTPYDSDEYINDYESIENTEIHQRIMRIFEQRINDAIQRKFENSINGSPSFKKEFLSNWTYQSENAEKMPIQIKTRYLKHLSMAIVVIPEGLTTDEAIELSEDLPCIKLVSPDYVKEIPPSDDSTSSFVLPLSSQFAASTGQSDDVRNKETERAEPNDPYFNSQWYMQSNEPYGLKPDLVWRELKDVSEITVAVIDSGCDLNHPDLASQFWTNPDEICGDGIDNDKNGYVDDCHGWDFVDNDNSPIPDDDHGTSVSGIIAAVINNSIGISGLCPNCKIMCLRFVKKGTGRTTDSLAALEYALTKKVRISNNSYGGYIGDDPIEREAVERAGLEFNHVFVASAGNDNLNTDLQTNFHYPSGYPSSNVLSVGSYSKDGKKSWFSNYGKKSVHLLVPGQDILSTLSGSGYSYKSGTSFSAPIVTSAVAMIWSKYPQLSYKSVINSILWTCNKSQDGDWTLSQGIIDLPHAIHFAGTLKT